MVAKAGENTVRWACKRLVRGVCERRWVFARPAGREKCEKSQFGAAVGRACRDAGIEVTDSGVKPRKSIEGIDAKPFLRFYPARDLHSRLLTLLDQIEESSDARLFSGKLSESVRELTSAGLDYYFVKTLKQAKVGFVTQQSANLGLIGVQQVMAPVIRNIIGRLEHAQLQAIARSIRQLMK